MPRARHQKKMASKARQPAAPKEPALGLAAVVRRCPELGPKVLNYLSYDDVENVIKACPEWGQQIKDDLAVKGRYV